MLWEWHWHVFDVQLLLHFYVLYANLKMENLNWRFLYDTCIEKIWLATQNAIPGVDIWQYYLAHQLCLYRLIRSVCYATNYDYVQQSISFRLWYANSPYKLIFANTTKTIWNNIFCRLNVIYPQHVNNKNCACDRPLTSSDF